MYYQSKNKHFSLMSLWTSSMMFALTFSTVNSVIMQPRLLSPTLEEIYPINRTKKEDNKSESFKIIFEEQDPYDVLVDSDGFLNIVLNRLYGQDVYVNVTVRSRPDLISFYDPNSKPNSTSPSMSNDITLHYGPDKFGDQLVRFHTKGSGHAIIVCKTNKSNIDTSKGFVSLNIGKSNSLKTFIDIVGWIYTLAWSISFYFQVALNYKRKSVIGLNFDFLLLNLFGFACYFVFNMSMLFSDEVQQEYYMRNEYKRIPVEYNDLFFSLHALIITMVTIGQCYFYERGQQRVSGVAKMFVTLISTLIIVMLIIYLTHGVKMLDVVFCISYIKLTITLIKYTPQAYFNYQRKATCGWSINNILLDFTGGVLSLVQMLLLAYNYDNWTSIDDNLTKFGIGTFSIIFDILFFVQHYVLYKPSTDQHHSEFDDAPDAVISQSIRQLTNESHSNFVVTPADNISQANPNYEPRSDENSLVDKS